MTKTSPLKQISSFILHPFSFLLAALVFLWLWWLDAVFVTAALGGVAWFLRLRSEFKSVLAQREDLQRDEHEN